MGTYDFVKKTGRDKIWERRKKLLEKIVNKETGELYENLTRPVKCCICGNEKGRLVFIKEGCRFIKCECGMVYINPQLKEEEAKNFYEVGDSDLWIDVLLSPLQYEYDREKFRNTAKEISRYATPGKILDVGCSIGLFLNEAKEEGWEVYGLELNKRACEVAKEKFDLDISPKTLEESGYPQNHFDAVSLWEVLEHVSDPTDLLVQVNRILKENGTLIILVPNINSLAVRVMHEKSSAFGKNHLWYFSPATLTKLLKKTNFNVIKVSTEISELKTMVNYLQFDDPYIGTEERENNSWITPDLLKVIGDKLCELNLGYKLRIYARKTGEAQ